MRDRFISLSSTSCMTEYISSPFASHLSMHETIPKHGTRHGVDS